MKTRFFLVTIFISITYLHAQQPDTIRTESLDEIVITATKYPIGQKNIGKVVYRITPEMISRQPSKSLTDLLNDVAGIEINGNFSTRGQNLGYYIRGGRNRQVVILLDGMNVTDPSSVSGDFDLRTIDLNQVERIEVLKGAAAILYGTGAATGVINIILKKAGKKPFQGSFAQYIGSNASQEEQNVNVNEISEALAINGSVQKFNYLVNLGALQSKGLSAGESLSKEIHFQEDPFIRYNSSFKMGYQFTDNVSLDAFANYDEFTSNYDSYDFFSGAYADTFNALNSIQRRVGLTPGFKYNKGSLKLNASYISIDRNAAPGNDIYNGKAFIVDIFNTYYLNKTLTVLTGIASQYNDMYQKTAYSSIEEGSARQHYYDPYLTVNWNSPMGFNLNLGGRLNIHSEYGSHFIYNINPSFVFDWDKSSLKIMGSYSTAYVTPTLQEIFNKSGTIGALNPEKDTNIEFGFDYNLNHSVGFNMVWFYREETDKIGFDPTTYQTINDSGTFLARGLEAEAHFNFSSRLTATANYSYVNREKSLLLKIPKNKANLSMYYNLTDGFTFGASGRFIDATEDYGGIALPSYRLFDINLNKTLIKNRFSLWAAVTNIFNEDFQEIAGLSTRGRNYGVGLKVFF